MAKANIINASPNLLSVNLNSALENHVIKAGDSLADDRESQTTVFTFYAWSAQVSSHLNRDVFAANGNDNTLLIFSTAFESYQAYRIVSNVSVNLEICVYVYGDWVVGTDQFGSTKDILVKRLSQTEATKLLAALPSHILNNKRPRLLIPGGEPTSFISY
ncbi:hypothetical protein [Pseudoalteromonas sp. McH1-42]|uniref:hypothetical protein n=1 Tax=Pseudoalteromonas sp. McH1-42 TaxID=2917752 RepID=UPI001EF47636|nr:hypothetical protein [Pseudoalteromonas sp. McH1-42]MCG7561326.1 hypothetical protein [Pseudoalteromonas sp. McH1-42]